MPSPGNFERVIRQMRNYGGGLISGAQLAMTKEARRIYDRSQELVPVALDTPTRKGGALKASGRLAGEVREPTRMSVEVRYGSDRAPYAAIVHEDLRAQHRPPTQAKFLQRAVDELSPQMSLRIGESAVAAARSRAR